MTDKRDKKIKYTFRTGMVTAFLICFLTACANPFGESGGREASEPSSESADTGFVVPGPDRIWENSTRYLLTEQQDYTINTAKAFLWIRRSRGILWISPS